MSATAIGTSVLRLADREQDRELVRRVVTGDRAAFEALDERYRAALVRYASSLLRRSLHDAEDVVQDVLSAVHDALSVGDCPDELRPWLYRLTHHRAINVVRRARWSDAMLDSEARWSHDDRDDPDAVFSRRDALRQLTGDLAELPPRQRTALLARELDGRATEEIAHGLGVSVGAAQMLISRARENITKMRAARDAACNDIRRSLLDARERGVRPTEHALRHLRGCDPCTASARTVRRAPATAPAGGRRNIGAADNQLCGATEHFAAAA